MRKLKSNRYLLAAVLGVAISLVTFGVVLAVTFFHQVTREVGSNLNFLSVEVLAPETLGLYNNAALDDPTTGLGFSALDLHPPLERPDQTNDRTVFIVNRAGMDLFLVQPCREIRSEGVQVGFMNPEIFDSAGNSRGFICDRPRIRLAPDEVVTAIINIHDLDPNLEPRDYGFTALFGAIGRLEVEGIIAPAGMVGWWPGDGNPDDYVRGWNAQLLGNFTTGFVDLGFEFDGVDDRATVGIFPDHNITGDVTVDFWAKRDGGGGAYLVQKGARNADVAYTLFFDAGGVLRAGFKAEGGGAVFLNGGVADTNFHFYTYVRAGTTHELFIDAEIVDSGDFGAQVPSNTDDSPLVFGAQSSGDGYTRFFDGIIDEIEIFDRNLNPDEIRAIFDAGPAGKIK